MNLRYHQFKITSKYLIIHKFQLVKVNLSRYRVIIKDKKIVRNKKWVKLHYKGLSLENFFIFYLLEISNIL